MKKGQKGEMILEAMEYLPLPVAIIVVLVAGTLMVFLPDWQEICIPIVVLGLTSILVKLGMAKGGQLWGWFKFKNGVKTPKVMKLRVKKGQAYMIETASFPEDEMDVEVDEGGFLSWSTFTGETFIAGDIEKIEALKKFHKFEKMLKAQKKAREAQKHGNM